MLNACQEGPHSSRQRRPRRRGFSLLELTVVLLLLGIVAAVAQPKFSETLSRYRVEAAAARLQSDLIYAQTLARVRSRATTIRFFVAAERLTSAYRLEGVPDPAVAANRFSPQTPSTWYRVALHEEPYRVALRAAPATLTFDLHGRPDTAAAMTLGLGTRTRRVRVIAGSGE